jgi:glycine cleavage system H lipoate-binding protein
MFHLIASFDLFATKGIEYLLAIAYLLILIPFWRMLMRQRRPSAKDRVLARVRRWAADWFHLPEGLHYHPGHAWAAPENENTLRIGVDDFAGKLVGAPAAVRLPARGTLLKRGQAAWRLDFGDTVLTMLSPVNGEVIEVNPVLHDRPELLARDPYGRGWLIRVRVDKPHRALRHLLSDERAERWMAETTACVCALAGGPLGEVLADGGAPVEGFVRELAEDDWERVAADFLLTASDSEGRRADDASLAELPRRRLARRPVLPPGRCRVAERCPEG